MVKLGFALNCENGWPPITVEHVWCQKLEEGYKLGNVPFFISGLAFGDIFKAQRDTVNDLVFDFELIRESGHSVVWVLNNIDLALDNFRNQLVEMGCRVERLEQFSLCSIDVPPDADVDSINNLLLVYEDKGLHFAYPVWRHGE